MNDTKKRIAEYKKKLPKLKEKVLATALLVILAFAMATTSTFAWLVLSRAPEASGVSTTVASNGNLEIALATGPLDMIAHPDMSQVGDSQLPLTERNITWGNLINLSDPSYGLDKLVLRPAMLNTSALTTSPLFGAVYAPDGRIEALSGNFGYATWIEGKDGSAGYFGITNNAGVRVISSTTVTSTGYPLIYENLKNNASKLNAESVNIYMEVSQNKKWMDSLATVMGTFMTAKLNSSDPAINNEDVRNISAMLEKFVEAYEKEVEAIAAMANFQMFVNANKEEISFALYTAETIMNETEASLKGKGVQIAKFNQFKTDFAAIKSYSEQFKVLATKSCKWSDLETIMNQLVNVASCTLDGTPISSIGMSNATNYIDGKVHQARITNGIIYRYEERTGGELDVTTSISATYMITLSIKARVMTSFDGVSLFQNDLQYGVGRNQGGEGTKTAEDTYGLAVDFWLRTNAKGAYLTLQGNVLTETKEVRATGTALDGTTVELYVAMVETDGTTYPVDAYKLGDQWYTIDGHEKITPKSYTPKMTTIETVIGYEGDNRVWEGSAGLSVNSTTQGSGSCYVYYADTPEDQARSLELLKSMYVVFADAEGNFLAKAFMDTEHHYAANGKVIVPLVLEANDIDLGADATGKVTRVITALEQNVPKFITTILYLDGTELNNDDVLAAADIQGQLNIQFGTTVKLNAVENEDLAAQEIRVSASVDKNSFDYDKTTTPMTSVFSVKVDGVNPTTISAYLIRAINATQGSREVLLNFTDIDGDGVWTKDYTFTSPGNYIIRSVQIDGVEYDLENRPTVTISGFALESLDWRFAGNSTEVMTAANSVTEEIHLKFATPDPTKMPNVVQGRFLREDGTAANINFIYNPTVAVWSGKVTFLTSGTYTLQYLVLDGKYAEIPTSLQKEITLNLGMQVAVYTESDLTFTYNPEIYNEQNPYNLYMKVKIMDNVGNELQSLSNVKLYYAMRGTSSAEKGLDADLTWNASTGYYEGVFKAKIGIYDFLRVTIGSDSVITYDTISPTFIVSAPNPPSFAENYNATTPVQYSSAASSNAAFKIKLNDAAAATMSAVLYKDGVEYGEVDGYISHEADDYYWIFPILVGEEESADGEWSIKELKVWDVSDPNGHMYTESNPYMLSVPEAGLSTTIFSDVKATITHKDAVDGALALGNKDTHGFMQLAPVDLKSFTILATNGEGGALPAGVTLEITKLSYAYDSSTAMAYGGYSFTQNIAEIPLTSSASNLQYAGVYRSTSAELLISYNGTPIGTLKLESTFDEKAAPDITVSSAPPTLNSVALSYSGKGVGETISFGYKDSTLFMTSHSVDMSKFAITSATDGAGNALPNGYNLTLSGVSLSYDQSTMLKYGGYTTNATLSNTYDLSVDSASLKYAGEYRPATATVTIEYKGAKATVSGVNVTAGPTFTVSSMKPTVTISAITPNGQHTTINNSDNDQTVTSSINGNTATVYCETSRNLNGKITTHPSVTLKLDNMGAAESATMIFTGNTNYLYTGQSMSGQTDAFTWTNGSSTCQRYVGQYRESNSCRGMTRNAAGTLTASSVTLVFNGASYTFTVDTITINNPN